VPREEIRRRVEEAAGWLGLEPLLGRKPGQLSGGQAQRVALGRALVREPQVFLMDEPLSNLDAKLRTQTRGEIKRLQQRTGTTTVYVTHDQVEAMTMGDRIAVMCDGRLEQCGTPEELYERPANRFVAGFIGSPAMSFFEASTHDSRLRSAHIDLPAPHGARLPASVTVGVRPEHARLWRDEAGLLGPIEGEVEYVEALGRETFIGVRCGEALVAVGAEGRVAASPGERVRFGLVPDGLRYFDPESGAALAGPSVGAAV
jgi:ABC-type sugar transport system ATPase subunit